MTLRDRVVNTVAAWAGFSGFDTGESLSVLWSKSAQGSTILFKPQAVMILSGRLQTEFRSGPDARDLSGDSQWFGKHWLQSIKDKNAKIYADAAYAAIMNGQKPPDTDTLRQATWGFQLLTFFGTEIGGQRSAETVKSSDKKTSVTLPTYNIARLRPKVAFTYEYKQLSLTATIVPRYLFAAENVMREEKVPDPKNASNQIAQIYLSKAQGLRVYGEAGISWQFDPAGHYALTVNYKLGSLPPNFDYVNTVQSGITMKF
jgi:hypothetical protein